MVTLVNNTVFLKVAIRKLLKSSHHKKLNMVIDVMYMVMSVN